MVQPWRWMIPILVFILGALGMWWFLSPSRPLREVGRPPASWVPKVQKPPAEVRPQVPWTARAQEPPVREDQIVEASPREAIPEVRFEGEPPRLRRRKESLLRAVRERKEKVRVDLREPETPPSSPDPGKAGEEAQDPEVIPSEDLQELYRRRVRILDVLE